MSVHFDEVKASMDRICAAWKTNDGSALANFFTDDGALISPFGERADGRAAISALYDQYCGNMLRGTSTTFDLLNVRTVGNDHAFVDGRQTIHAPDGAVVLVVHLAALLRRDGDGWRLVDSRPYTYATR